MWDGELGTDEKFYHRYLKEITPRLKSLSSKKYAEYVKIFYKEAHIEPEIDEDVHAIMSDIVHSIGEKLEIVKQYELPEPAIYKPEEIDEDKELYDIYHPGSGISAPLWVSELTDYGLFEKEVNLCYSKLSKAGWVRYGRERNKEETIFFIILVLALRHPEIHPVDGISKDDYNIVLEGCKHNFKKANILIQEEWRKDVTNEHKYNILLSENSLPNLTASLIPRVTNDLADIKCPRCVDIRIRNTLEVLRVNDLADIKCPHCGSSFSEAAFFIQSIFPVIWELKGKALHKKLIEHEEEKEKAGKKIRPYKRILLINMFYSARSLENEIGIIFFRKSSELQKIWGIPRRTWSDMWNLLASLDEKL
jgi:DNA-directed RNA polymerase subunit RPC12/RpoP